MRSSGVLEMISRSPEEHRVYDMRLKFQRDEATRLSSTRREIEAARSEGETKGRVEGHREGETKGRVEGLREGETKGRVEGMREEVQKGVLLGRIALLQELLGGAKST